jgi:hypothetical protein
VSQKPFLRHTRIRFFVEVRPADCSVFPDEIRALIWQTVSRFDKHLVPLGDFERRNEKMPRYIVERTFPDGLAIPVNDQGANTCLLVVGNNAKDGVTWVHSYVTGDKTKTFCVYDAPSPEAVHSAAQRNGLPVDKITEVRVLDPYFYQ